MKTQRPLFLVFLLALFAAACVAPPEDSADPAEGVPGGDEALIATSSDALSSSDCSESSDTGYTSGKAFAITVVTVDGKKVEKDTANAYYVMAKAAAAAGVNLKIVSGFRTMAEQQYLYNCYVNCSCNNCNLAAKPGYSNHQSGHALDLNTSASGVLTWLNNHGATYGFKRTVPSETWHWEWWGGGPGGGPCGKAKYAGESLGLSGQSYPIVSQGAVEVEVGETVTGWVKLKNIGTETWKAGTVKLAPIPRDKPSPFASPSWLSDHRISTPSADVKPGSVGEFPLDITGSVEGESLLELGWVAEGITWFADSGGPKDGYFAVKVKVVPSTKPPGTGGQGGAAGATGSGGSGSGGDAGAAGTTGAGGSAGSSWGDGGVIGAAGKGSSGTKVLADPGSDGGCSVSTERAPTPSWPWLTMAALGLALIRRKRG